MVRKKLKIFNLVTKFYLKFVRAVRWSRPCRPYDSCDQRCCLRLSWLQVYTWWMFFKKTANHLLALNHVIYDYRLCQFVLHRVCLLLLWIVLCFCCSCCRYCYVCVFPVASVPAVNAVAPSAAVRVPLLRLILDSAATYVVVILLKLKGTYIFLGLPACCVCVCSIVEITVFEVLEENYFQECHYSSIV